LILTLSPDNRIASFENTFIDSPSSSEL